MENNTSCSYCGKPLYRRVLKSLSFCDNGCKSEYQKLQRPVTVEWLRQKYVDERMDCTQIAVIVGRDPKSVWNWLKGSGIATRGRGPESGQSFEKGQQSAFAGKQHTVEVKENIRLARLADGHVPYLQNGVHHLKGKRGAATPNWKGGITPERASVYGSPEWKQAVKAVWKRDNAICQRCKLDHRTIKRGTVAFDIHHIKGFECIELRCDPGNLVLLCEPCHHWVHSRANKKKEFIK